jgi:hypothetical protein
MRLTARLTPQREGTVSIEAGSNKDRRAVKATVVDRDSQYLTRLLKKPTLLALLDQGIRVRAAVHKTRLE